MQRHESTIAPRTSVLFVACAVEPADIESLVREEEKEVVIVFFYVKEAQCHTQGRQDFYYGAAPGFHVIIGLLLQFLRAAFISMLAMQISVGLLRRVCDTKRKAGRQYQKFKVGRHPFFLIWQEPILLTFPRVLTVSCSFPIPSMAPLLSLFVFFFPSVAARKCRGSATKGKGEKRERCGL